MIVGLYIEVILVSDIKRNLGACVAAWVKWGEARPSLWNLVRRLQLGILPKRVAQFLHWTQPGSNPNSLPLPSCEFPTLALTLAFLPLLVFPSVWYISSSPLFSLLHFLYLFLCGCSASFSLSFSLFSFPHLLSLLVWRHASPQSPPSLPSSFTYSSLIFPLCSRPLPLPSFYSFLYSRQPSMLFSCILALSPSLDNYYLNITIQTTFQVR